jgi:hypothetical protein
VSAIGSRFFLVLLRSRNYTLHPGTGPVERQAFVLRCRAPRCRAALCPAPVRRKAVHAEHLAVGGAAGAWRDAARGCDGCGGLAPVYAVHEHRRGVRPRGGCGRAACVRGADCRIQRGPEVFVARCDLHGGVDGAARLRRRAPAMVRGVRVPRRLRHGTEQHLGVGRPALLRLARERGPPGDTQRARVD